MLVGAVCVKSSKKSKFKIKQKHREDRSAFGFEYLNAGLLARSRYTSGRFCDLM
jgi:hypothetical protein